MSAVTYILYIVTGLLHQLAAYVIPFRPVQGRADIRWDFIGLIAAVAFGYASVFFIETPLLSAIFDSEWNQTWYEWIVKQPLWLLIVTAIVLTDFCLYWTHRLLHSKYLWHTHAWHHAPKYLWWMAGLRGSPLHVIMNFAPSALVYAFFPTPDNGPIAVALALHTIVNQHYQHSNIKFPFASQLEWVFVTPRYHFVHHSANPIFTNSNYGFVFSVWDRMFATYTDPTQVSLDEELGLDYRNSNLRLLFGLPPQNNN
ncbi:MAG: sterol desaturase family protein [Pseudomonadales bacterium]